MRPDPATEALRELLARLADRIPPGQIDRLWLFPIRTVGSRESGLVVVSTLSPTDAGGPRRVLTVRYEIRRTREGVTAAETLAEQGTAPAEHVDRVIAGVIRRLGDDAGQPVPHHIAGDPDRWSELILSLGAAAVDPTSGE